MFNNNNAAENPASFPDVQAKPQEIDWNEVWSKEMEKYKASNRGFDCAEQWIDFESALKYWNTALEFHSDRIHRTLCGFKLRPDFRVLDIGSGPGVLAIPVAKRVAEVTAVDSSAAMLSVLQQKAHEQGVNNIYTVNKRWEDVDTSHDLIGRYDIVIASLSLGMGDLKDSILKMEEVSKGSVALIWFAGSSAWESMSRRIMRLYSDSSYCSPPKGNVVFNLLYQLGVFPDVEVFPYRHVNKYDSLSEVVQYLRKRLCIPSTVEDARILHCGEGLIHQKNGHFALESWAVCMKICWNPTRLSG